MWSLLTKFLTEATIKTKPPTPGGWKLCSSASGVKDNPSVWYDTLCQMPRWGARPWAVPILLWCPSSCWRVIHPTSVSIPTSGIPSVSKSLVQTLMQVAELPLKHKFWAAYGFLALLLELNPRSFALRLLVWKGAYWWPLLSGLLTANLWLVFQKLWTSAFFGILGAAFLKQLL